MPADHERLKAWMEENGHTVSSLREAVFVYFNGHFGTALVGGIGAIGRGANAASGQQLAVARGGCHAPATDIDQESEWFAGGEKAMSNELKVQRMNQLAHAVQTGVAMMMEYDSTGVQPKHLRVGINMAMVEGSALGELLIAKGIITEDEYLDALIAGLEKEVARYEAEISAKLGGAKVTLG